MRIAIIGSGIAGNVVAYRLHREHEVTVFESADHIGGHAHTHVVQHEGRDVAVDTGFIVFNDRTYPQFVALLDELGVESQASEMSFSVRCAASGLEYNGTTINSLFAQRRNLCRPSFWRMIRDILRFNREAPRLLHMPDSDVSLADYLREQRYSAQFIQHYIVPMGAAVWSVGTTALQQIPAQFFIRFFHHHGMLSIDHRPQWRTIRGGSARYVAKLTAPYRNRIRSGTPVERVSRTATGVLVSAGGAEPWRFDRVFFACHSDQALQLLSDADAFERATLGALKYERNDVVLHTDTAVLPRRKLAWAAWNYHIPESERPRVAVTYNMKLLQRLETRTPLLVSLNMGDSIDPAKVIKRVTYEHPIFTREAVAAQSQHARIDGANRAYFCGAYWRYGFHEDGVVSALAALDHFRQREYAQRPVRRTA
jgi:predicted NAD/FAD-binding protein